jgi:hypothetical protein
MQIRLTRKFAAVLDGIDLSLYSVGEIVDMPEHDAVLLIAEAWAARSDDLPSPTSRVFRCLRRVCEQLRRRRFEPQPQRRAEDRFREELHDSRASTVWPSVQKAEDPKGEDPA